MSDVFARLNRYQESFLAADNYLSGTEAADLVFQAVAELERYREALRFYGDSSKYYYAKQDHPYTRLAEDGGELARTVLGEPGLWDRETT